MAVIYAGNYIRRSFIFSPLSLHSFFFLLIVLPTLLLGFLYENLSKLLKETDVEFYWE